MFLALRIAFWMFITVTKRKLILWVAAIKESKGILLTLAEFVKRLQIRISRFLLMFAIRLMYRFSGSINRGL